MTVNYLRTIAVPKVSLLYFRIEKTPRVSPGKASDRKNLSLDQRGRVLCLRVPTRVDSKDVSPSLTVVGPEKALKNTEKDPKQTRRYLWLSRLVDYKFFF